MFVSLHATQSRFDVEECGGDPSVSLRRMGPTFDLPGEIAGDTGIVPGQPDVARAASPGHIGMGRSRPPQST